MAFDYSFGPGVALDPLTLRSVPGASGFASASAEDTTPLTVMIGGVETTEIQSGSDAIVQGFRAEVPSVWLHFPGITPYRVDSFAGVVAVVNDAAESALDASNTAAEMLTRTFSTTGGILQGPNLSIFATRSAAEAACVAANAAPGSLVLVEDPDA